MPLSGKRYGDSLFSGLLIDQKDLLFLKQIITICLPLRISMERLSQAHPDFFFLAVWQDYSKVVPKPYCCVTEC